VSFYRAAKILTKRKDQAGPISAEFLAESDADKEYFFYANQHQLFTITYLSPERRFYPSFSPEFTNIILQTLLAEVSHARSRTIICDSATMF